LRKRGILRGRAIYSPETRERTLEHARAELQAGATLRKIALDLGIAQETLEVWLNPKPAERFRRRVVQVPRLRPVTVVGPGTELPPITGLTVILPNGMRICGLTVDQATAIVKALG